MRLIFTFIVLFLSILLGVTLSKDPGYLLIAFNHWTLETTVWVALAALIIGFILLHSAIVFYKTLSSLPGNFKAWRHRRKLQHSQLLTRKGLLEFSEGNWSLAEKHLSQALPYAESPLINYLIAARAAQESGESQRRDDFLGKAEQLMPDTKIAVELTQAALQISQQQWEQALTTLKHLQTLAPTHPYVLKLLAALYQELKDWKQLIALLPLLKKQAGMTAEAFAALRYKAWFNALQDQIKTQPFDEVAKFFQTLPKDLKSESGLIALYALFLIKDQQLEKAEILLRQRLKAQFDEEIIRIYGIFSINIRQLTFAEGFLKKYPHCAALYLSLARLCLFNQLWGRAEDYLKQSIALKPAAETYTELGNYYLKLNQIDKACYAFKEASNLSLSPCTQMAVSAQVIDNRIKN